MVQPQPQQQQHGLAVLPASLNMDGLPKQCCTSRELESACLCTNHSALGLLDSWTLHQVCYIITQAVSNAGGLLLWWLLCQLHGYCKHPKSSSLCG
jgi:hypothetical protein